MPTRRRASVLRGGGREGGGAQECRGGRGHYHRGAPAAAGGRVGFRGFKGGGVRVGVLGRGQLEGRGLGRGSEVGREGEVNTIKVLRQRHRHERDHLFCRLRKKKLEK